MINSNIEDQQTKKVYFRLTSKYAKIAYLPTNISTDQLYLFVSQTYSLPIEHIHLFYQGKLLPTSTIINLQENAIIHIVRLNSVSKQKINFSIKMIGSNKVIWQQVTSSKPIKFVVEETVCPSFKVKAGDIVLVYLGRQLRFNRSFEEQQVEDGSQILCLLQVNQQAHLDQSIRRSNSNPKVAIPIQRLQSPLSPKNIYPKPDFVINVPEDINTTTNHLSLIFDSKVVRSSSIQNVQLLPEEIIPEQESNFSADFVKHSHSYRSGHREQSRQKDQCLSQQWNIKSAKQSSIHKLNLQNEMNDFKSNQVIYAANFHILKDSKVMRDLISQQKDKVRLKIEKSEGII